MTPTQFEILLENRDITKYIDNIISNFYKTMVKHIQEGNDFGEAVSRFYDIKDQLLDIQYLYIKSSSKRIRGKHLSNIMKFGLKIQSIIDNY